MDGATPRGPRVNAIAIAHTPNYDDISRQFPMTTLAASGASVGQADDSREMLRSEHLNMEQDGSHKLNLPH